jgi:hypothetical protein
MGSLDGKLLGPRTKDDSLPSCVSKRKRTRGLSGRCRISRVILGCGK